MFDPVSLEATIVDLDAGQVDDLFGRVLRVHDTTLQFREAAEDSAVEDEITLAMAFSVGPEGLLDEPYVATLEDRTFFSLLEEGISITDTLLEVEELRLDELSIEDLADFDTAAGGTTTGDGGTFDGFVDVTGGSDFDQTIIISDGGSGPADPPGVAPGGGLDPGGGGTFVGPDDPPVEGFIPPPPVVTPPPPPTFSGFTSGDPNDLINQIFSGGGFGSTANGGFGGSLNPSASLFTSIDFGTVGDTTFALTAPDGSLASGILLTSGTGTPSDNNFGDPLSVDFGVTDGADGDADLDALAETVTFDATTLSFDITTPLVNDNGDPINAVVFMVMYGSEAPSISSQDIAAIFVDGTNVLTLNEDQFFDNSVESGALLDIAYDGLTAPMLVVVPVTGGETHTIKIAIADTGDSLTDSGLFITGFGLGAVEESGTEEDDILVGDASANTLEGLDGDDFIFGLGSNDTLTGGAGDDFIDGGDGAQDTAVFSGNFADYTVIGDNSAATITDNNLSDGDDGTDTLINIDLAQFADVTIALGGSNVAPDIDLVDVADGTGGFKIIGENSGDKAGFSVSSAGDVNGDGFDDVVVGAIGVDAVINGVGAAYVVFGASDGLTSVNLDAIAAGTGGFKIIGEGFNNDNAGWRVSGAGDVNGDGIDDLIVSSVFNGNSVGAAYVVFGATSGLASLNLADVAAGTGGFKIIGENISDQAGSSVSSAGDVNGDGIDDLLVGAWHNFAAGPTAGAAYVVFGDTSVTTAVNLDDVANGTGGFRIVGEVGNDYAGFSVSSAGDVNGDGVDDVIVGAFGDDTGGNQAGAAYVVYGATGGLSSVDLDDVAGGTGGFKIFGETAFDRAGWSVSSAGDVNGDGFDDVFIGVTSAGAGAAFVVFGAASEIASVNLDDIALGTGGFKITGEADGDRAGRSVSAAGDVNGDGFDDLIVGASENDEGGLNTGAAYVVFGGAGLTSVNLGDVAAGIGGFKIIGEAADDDAGYAVSAAGDIDGDGFDDLIVGARDNNADGLDSGAAYIIFGRDFTSQVDFLGTDGDDTLTFGTAADEILIGGRGNDTIDGGGGDDVIIGGAGNDTIIFDSATDTLKVDGGTGIDTLSVTGSGVTLDLTAIGDGVYEGFERIDLTGGGNTLILAASDLYAITDGVNAKSGNTLIVDGGSGDAVDAGGNWVFVSNTVNIGLTQFTKYTQDAAILLVDNDVDQSAIGIIAPAIELADIAAGSGGFKITGKDFGDFAGLSVSSAGDVNGDGFEDLIVGAPGVDADGNDYGASYVVFGAAGGISSVDLAALGTGGFKIIGEDPNDKFGRSVSSAGDVNGDGFDDLIVGAISDDGPGQNSGAAYVMFGAANITSVNLTAIAGGTGGFKITGEDGGDLAGRSVSSAGDVNGDGVDDVIVGAYLNDIGTTYGAAYVVFGSASGITSIDLEDVDAGTGGFKITGESSYDAAGMSVASAGDVNGDGFDDLIVGAPYNSFGDEAGAAYVVFGAPSGITEVDLRVRPKKS